MSETNPSADETAIDLGETPVLADFLQRMRETLNVLRGNPDGQVAKFNNLHLLLPPGRMETLKKYIKADGTMDTCEYRTQFAAGDNAEELDALLRFLAELFTMATTEHSTWTTHIAGMSVVYTANLHQKEHNYGFVGLIDWQTPVQLTAPQGTLGEGEEPL